LPSLLITPPPYLHTHKYTQRESIMKKKCGTLGHLTLLIFIVLLQGMLSLFLFIIPFFRDIKFLKMRERENFVMCQKYILLHRLTLHSKAIRAMLHYIIFSLFFLVKKHRIYTSFMLLYIRGERARVRDTFVCIRRTLHHRIPLPTQLLTHSHIP
jgi:hypothetical protein